MRRMIKDLSAPGKTVMGIGVLLLLMFVCGGMSFSGDVPVSQEQAIDIAAGHVDFDYEDVGTRLIRQGFQNIPVWAVAFSVPGQGGNEYEELVMVEVNGRTGEVVRVRTAEELGYTRPGK